MGTAGDVHQDGETQRPEEPPESYSDPDSSNDGDIGLTRLEPAYALCVWSCWHTL